PFELLQQHAQSARAESQAPAQILQSRLAVVHHVTRYVSRFAAQLNGRKKRWQLLFRFAGDVRGHPQRLGILDPAEERLELAPVESLAEGHQVLQKLFQRLRTAAAVCRQGQREYGVAQSAA